MDFVENKGFLRKEYESFWKLNFVFRIFSYLNLLRRAALRQKPFFKGPSDKNLITIYR